MVLPCPILVLRTALRLLPCFEERLQRGPKHQEHLAHVRQDLRRETPFDPVVLDTSDRQVHTTRFESLVVRPDHLDRRVVRMVVDDLEQERTADLLEVIAHLVLLGLRDRKPHMTLHRHRDDLPDQGPVADGVDDERQRSGLGDALLESQFARTLTSLPFRILPGETILRLLNHPRRVGSFAFAVSTAVAVLAVVLRHGRLL